MKKGLGLPPNVPASEHNCKEDSTIMISLGFEGVIPLLDIRSYKFVPSTEEFKPTRKGFCLEGQKSIYAFMAKVDVAIGEIRKIEELPIEPPYIKPLMTVQSRKNNEKLMINYGRCEDDNFIPVMDVGIYKYNPSTRELRPTPRGVCVAGDNIYDFMKKLGYARDKIENTRKRSKPPRPMADKQIDFKITTDLSLAFTSAFTGREIVESAKRSLDAAEGFNKLSQSTGTTVEEISGFTYAAKLADVSQEALGMGLKNLSRGMMDAAAGTGDAKDAFDAMGLSVTDASGGLKTTGDMLIEVSEKFAGYEDSAGKTALAMKIFGRSGADLIPLLNQGKAGLAEAAKEGRAFGVVIGKEAAEAAERFNDNLKRLKDGALSGFAQLHKGMMSNAR
jgi:hypothetical protein